jgi:hypothetical protein
MSCSEAQQVKSEQQLSTQECERQELSRKCCEQQVGFSKLGLQPMHAQHGKICAGKELHCKAHLYSFAVASAM